MTATLSLCFSFLFTSCHMHSSPSSSPCSAWLCLTSFLPFCHCCAVASCTTSFPFHGRMPASCPQRSARLQGLTNQPLTIAGRGNSQGGSVASKKGPVPTQPQGTIQKKCRTRGGKSALASLPIQESAPQISAVEPTKKSGTNIIWEGTRTDQLVSWIMSHAADRHILFHDCLTSTPTPVFLPSDKPSSKNKKDVLVAIAKHIFGGDPEHATLHAPDPTRYVTSVTNCLGA